MGSRGDRGPKDLGKVLVQVSEQGDGFAVKTKMDVAFVGLEIPAYFLGQLCSGELEANTHVFGAKHGTRRWLDQAELRRRRGALRLRARESGRRGAATVAVSVPAARPEHQHGSDPERKQLRENPIVHHVISCSNWAVNAVPSSAVASTPNRHAPTSRSTPPTKWPGPRRLTSSSWPVSPSRVALILASATGSSPPEGSKKVKCTSLAPGVPGSTYA